MNIIHIIPNLKCGGAERLVIDICNELAARPNVHVLLINLYPEIEYNHLSDKVNRVVTSSFIKTSITKKWKKEVEHINTIIKNFKPDIIHSHLFESELISRNAILPNVKYYTHCHDNIYQYQKLSLKTFLNKKAITAYYERLAVMNLYKKCKNIFITISKDTFKYINTNVTVKNKSMHLLYNAIDYKKFHHLIDYEQLNNKEKLILVSIGSLVKKKNHILLIQIANELKRQKINFELNILGDGELRKILENYITEYRLEHYVFLRGNQKSVESWLQNSHIYIHSATYEPFGLAILEAMASGLPVISLDGGGNRDILLDNQNSFLIKNENPDAFVSKILKLSSEPKLYKKISLEARKFSSNFDIKKYVDQLLAIYIRE